MPYDFGFKPFDRPLVNAPLGAFSGLADTLSEKYDVGVQITEDAKDAYGTMKVAPKDQTLRNQLADEVTGTLNGIATKYSGAYESKRFRTDARAAIREMAARPELRAMRETLGEFNYVKELERKSRSDPRMNLIRIGEEKSMQTTFNEETGEWESYKSPYETGQDWRKDAINHMGKFTAEEGSTPVDIEILKSIVGNLPLIKEGRYKELDANLIRERADQIVNDFIISNEGGNQMSRKIMSDLINDGMSEESADKKMREYIAGYLYNSASNQAFDRNTIYSYQNLPSGFLKDPSSTFIENPYDRTLPFDVATTIEDNLGFDPDTMNGTVYNQDDVNTQLPEGVEDTRTNRILHGISTGVSGRGRSEFTFAPTGQHWYERFSDKERDTYNNTVTELSTALLGKSINPNSEEARGLVNEYIEAVETIAQNPTFTFYENLLEPSGESKSANATKDVKNNWPNKAMFDFKTGKELSEDKLKDLDRENINVLGEINEKHSITTSTGNNAYANAYYAVDNESGNGYLITMPAYRMNSAEGIQKSLKNSLYNEIILKPGLKVRLGEVVENIIGKGSIEARSEITKDGSSKITPNDLYSLWIEGDRITVDGEPVMFNSFDKMINALVAIKDRK